MMWYNNREPSWYNQELGLSYLNLNVLLLLLHFTLSVYTKETNGQQHPKWRNNWGQVCPSHNVVWRPSVIVFSSSSFPYVFHFLRSRCAKTFHRVLFCFFSKDRCPPYYQWSLGKERREKRSSQVPVVVFFFLFQKWAGYVSHTHTHTPRSILMIFKALGPKSIDRNHLENDLPLYMQMNGLDRNYTGNTPTPPIVPCFL